jgi:hypothetical protein
MMMMMMMMMVVMIIVVIMFITSNMYLSFQKGQFIHIMQYIFTAIFTVEMSIKVQNTFFIRL